MDKIMDLIYETKQKMLIKYPRFGSEIATTRIELREDLKYHTAATDGKNVYIDPNYFVSLSEDDRLFIIAHEIMHIKFLHPSRLKDKNGNMRDMDVWNEACDAIINANLERDGFIIKKGFVNRPEALNYTAEEFYEILLKEKKDQGKFCDDHSLWEEAFKEDQSRIQKNEDSSSRNSSSEHEDKIEIPDDLKQGKGTEIKFGFDEKLEFRKNRQEKIERYKAKRDKTNRQIRTNSSDEKISLGNIGKETNGIDWKLLIRKAAENNQTVWSKRRSIAENNYAYRLEENEIDDASTTEVMIDVSGSVKLELVKAFLRELKTLLKQSNLKVGCFNAKFWGMVDIKKEEDIDNFSIPIAARGIAAWTEDWDLAVRSFSKDRTINKIVFTDGLPQPGNMPKDDLKKEDVIWLVYGNKDFNPCCGRVINVDEQQIKKMNKQHCSLEK